MAGSAAQLILPPRSRLSPHTLFLCCSCFLATCLGSSAIAISLTLVVIHQAGSPLYWSTFGVLLLLWSLTLADMCRRTIASIARDHP